MRKLKKKAMKYLLGSFDHRFDREFMKYADKPLTIQQFDELMKKMIQFR